MSSDTPTKEALCVIIDVSDHMRPHLDAALESVRLLINDKILFHKQDAFGIVLHGTKETCNSVAADCGEDQYTHITELHPMGPVNHKTLEALERLNHFQSVEDGDSADLIDSLLVGMMSVIAFVKKLKFAKRVIMLTDGLSTANTEGDTGDQLDAIAQQLKDSQIRFEVLGIGFGLAPFELRNGGDDGGMSMADNTHQEVREVLHRLENAVGKEHFALTSIGDAQEAITALKVRSVRPGTNFRGPLDIGGVAIPVWSWRKIVPSQPPKMILVSKAALDDQETAANPTGTIITERRHTVPNRPDDDVPPDLHTPVNSHALFLWPLCQTSES